ncbi:MAG: glycosyltransferase family 4 protein [Bacteroidota bacterium]|nr:glycosyltransferase family 4 protein [Bacteroidota bacterium]
MQKQRWVGFSASKVLGGADIIFHNLINNLPITVAILNLNLKDKIKINKTVSFFRFHNVDKNTRSIVLYIKNYFPAFFRLNKLLKKGDIIICNDFLALTYCFAFKFIKGADIIFYCHSAFTPSLFNKLFLSAFVNLTAKKIIVPSFFLESELIKTGILKSKIRVVYNGIESYHTKETESEFHHPLLKLGIFGGIHTQKGQDTFIDALIHLKTIGFETKGYIVGDIYDPEFYNRIKEKTNGLYDELIEYTGFINYNETRELMAAMDIVVCVSKYRETLPTVLLEALSHKKPVIATEIGGIPEIIETHVNGILVPADNPLDLANAVLQLKEPDIRKKMGKAGFEIFQRKFTWKQFLNRIENEINI